MTDWISYAYAAAIGSGGVVTYAKSGCPVALVLGVVGGGMAGYGAYKSSIDPSNTLVLQGVSMVHGAVYAHRWYKTKKFVPAGIFASLSAFTLARSIYMMRHAAGPSVYES